MQYAVNSLFSIRHGWVIRAMTSSTTRWALTRRSGGLWRCVTDRMSLLCLPVGVSQIVCTRLKKVTGTNVINDGHIKETVKRKFLIKGVPDFKVNVINNWRILVQTVCCNEHTSPYLDRYFGTIVIGCPFSEVDKVCGSLYRHSWVYKLQTKIKVVGIFGFHKGLSMNWMSCWSN